MAGPYAFVTLVTSDAYLPGALAQAAALRDLHPNPPVFPEVPFQTLCLVTPETVDVASIKLLRRAFDLVIGVEVLEQENNRNLQLLGRPDLTTVLTKLHVFRLTQYSKIVFLDADVLPIRPLSHLFNIPHEFAAAPDVGWPDIFNSGVLVLSPGVDKFNDLNQLLDSKGSWDGGDQGLLNEWRAGDWHRLSFTYNTTPTAAYTYAPAYERYGSHINAIHFIGPNKPWSAIPFRSPFLAEKRVTSSKASETPSSQQAYDYESLVDRWFAVYDKHYRSQPIATPSFEVKRYPSAWHASGSTNPSEVTPDRPFTLEDLRKIAIEGMTGTGFETQSFAGRTGEGEYRSMPLEGRFDLMRPKKPQVESDDDSPSTPGATLSPEPKLESDFFSSERDLPMTPMASHVGLPDDPVRWHALPTPDPNEIPPRPKLPLKSLPATPTPAPGYYASSAGPTSDSEGRGGADVGPAIPFPSHLFHQTPPPEHPRSLGTSHGEPSNPQRHHHGHNHHHGQDEHSTSHHHHKAGDAIHERTQLQNDQSHHTRTPRPLEPPLVPWNPALEPPPNDPPPPSNFPMDTYFTNVWDANHNYSHSPPKKGILGSSLVFFQAPPTPQIPQSLLQQGHYRNVTGEAAPGSSTNPDPSKVKSVFPWEDKPRQMPSRVFPESDTPSPSRFVNPTKPSSPPTPISKTLDRSKPLKPSPVSGLPTSLTFSNVWDAVPSIQNYASQLALSPPGPPPGPASDGDQRRNNGRGQNWDEKTEASSQDGDDEDEGDNDEDVESDDDRRSRPRNRKSSAAEDTRQVQKAVQKTYRSLGVQTLPKEKRSQSVQVSVLVEAPPSRAASRRSSVSARRSWATSNGSATFRDVNRASEFLVKSSPAPGPVRSRSVSNGSFGHSSTSENGPRSQREFITSPLSQPPRPPAKSFPPHIPERPRGSTPPKAPTPRQISPPKAASPLPGTAPARPSIQTNRHALGNLAKARRQTSNDSSNGSPPSSVGPSSPPDDQPPGWAIPVRKGTRVWDPARGVESFKRGSEEVLARFLKMGSWEENMR